MIGLAATLVMATLPALTEPRYCGPPPRNERGEIIRRADVLRAFERANPCPAKDAAPGTCPGFIRDHVVPLACGGCDAVGNLQWLPVEVWRAKSLWERKVYGGRGMSVGCP